MKRESKRFNVANILDVNRCRESSRDSVRAHVRNLANLTCRLTLSFFVPVDSNLHREDNKHRGQRERQGARDDLSGFVAASHFDYNFNSLSFRFDMIAIPSPAMAQYQPYWSRNKLSYSRTLS
jgi:hypothetical protein